MCGEIINLEAGLWMILLHISENCSHLYKTGSVDLMKPRNISSRKEKMKTWFSSVDITSIMYFSLKNDKRASTGMDKGFHFNLMSFNLMNDNHTIPSNLKIRSLDRFDDFRNFHSATDLWLFSGRRSCQCCKGPEDATVYSGKGEDASLNFTIRQFKTSVTFN